MQLASQSSPEPWVPTKKKGCLPMGAAWLEEDGFFLKPL